MAVACPRVSHSDMFIGSNASRNTRPAFLGMCAAYLCAHRPYCPPLPDPRHVASGCFCRRSFLRPTVASFSFLWSVCRPIPEILGQGPEMLLAVPVCPQPYALNAGGWERATHLFKVPSGGGPTACFPEVFIPFALTRFCEAIM